MCGKAAIDGLTHPKCLNTNAIDGCFVALEYASVMKKLIYVFKYQPYVTDIQHMLSELFYEALIQKEAFMRVGERSDKLVIVPIPLHHNKLRIRGYNHAKLLSQNLGKKLHIPCQDLLIRVRETAIQASLSKEQRKENMKNAFALKSPVSLQNTIVFLVDDIVTTGVTCVEAAKVLKKAGAKAVFSLAFTGEN
jgi:competence protein ComFC